MMWAVKEPLRFRAEKQAVDELEESVPWLTVLAWKFLPNGRICVEFDIKLDNSTFDGVLTYPQSFPIVPPAVSPREKRRWSGHQYGEQGDLCLEYGPDNWNQQLTGADMISSAHRLLSGESPVHDGLSIPVPTRHELTLGQELRSGRARLVMTAALEAKAAELLDVQDATFSIRFPGEDCIVVLASLDGEPPWLDGSVPQSIVDAGTKIRGRVLQVPTRPSGLTGRASELRSLLGAPVAEDVPIEVLLCRAVDGHFSAYYLINSSDQAFEIAIVPSEPQMRLSEAFSALAGCSVGLVGCGSLGSKIASSLARAGIGRFVLVDDDVLRPGNLVRHDLDWNSVGRHKVDALADRLKALAPSVVVDVRRHRLGAQESNGGLDGVVSTLSRCSLLIDATADPRAFNYAAAAAAERRRPMLWAEVFGGGFGGLVARTRPGREPDPQSVRAAIEAWCAERRIDPPQAGNNYDGVHGDVTMIADDASVSTIASHATAMAIDTILGHEPSQFPSPIYVIGMRREWIFQAPFDTWPVNLQSVPAQPPSTDYQDPDVIAALAELGELVGE
jgi:molybdopterin/thiamine biosynthesis adenylyltransferase